MTTKEKIIFAVSTVLVGAAGFTAGYFIGKNRMKKATDDIIEQMNDEINEYAAMFATKTIEDKVVVNGTTNYEGFKRTPEQEEAYKRAKELARKNDELKKEYFERIKKEGYNGVTSERRQEVIDELNNMSDEEKERIMETDSDEEDRIAENEAMGLESDEDYEERTDGLEDDLAAGGHEYNNLPPYIISEQEYMDPQFDGYVKHLFTYFGDGTLIDDGDELVVAPEEVIGADNLIEFESGDKDVLFVRDERINADYEVMYKEMSYDEYMGAR